MSNKNDYTLDQNPVYEHFKGSAVSQTSHSLQDASLKKPTKTVSYTRGFCCVLCIIIMIVCLACVVLSTVSFLKLRSIQMQHEDQHETNLRLNLQAQESNNLSVLNAEMIQSRLEQMNMLEIQIQKLNQSLNTLKNSTVYQSQNAEISQEQLGTTINTNQKLILDRVTNIERNLTRIHQSWHTRAARIENTTNTNHQIILDRVINIERNLTTNHQSWMSKAEEIENTVNTNKQNILNRATQIESSVSMNHQSLQTRTAQIEDTINTNQQVFQGHVVDIERNLTTNIQSWMSRAEEIENTVNTNQQNILNRATQIESSVSMNHQSLQTRAAQIENMVTTNSDSINSINSRGVTYIRWGHNACPTRATTVYTGQVGGTPYEHRGGASNLVCLPDSQVEYLSYSRANTLGRSYMYGSEYDQPINANHDDNVPCAVCSVTNRQQVLMIPAKYNCPTSDWTREYYGFLMSAHMNNYKSSFICVDYNQVSIPNSGGHTVATDLVHVEAYCPSSDSSFPLPCGQNRYSSGKGLACVVCTK